MPTARVVAVAPDSPAAHAGLLAGDELLSVNGEALRDVIRYQLQADEPRVEVELRRGGIEREVVVEKRAGEPLGVELASAVFDQIRTCDNHCSFCFIYQLPTGMRKSLFVKDDDYRLSFLYGNFTTLTRFTEADLERVVTERLGPLYVSIHATDPDLRSRLLRNRRGATSLRWLSALLEAGIEVHGQVVVCPGINDGAALDDTLLGILDLYPRLASVGLVPLGVSAHTTEQGLRPHTADEVRAVLETVERWQPRFLTALGRRLVFAADEYYLLAGAPYPDADAYEGFVQHENGIGMARSFRDDVADALAGHPTRSVAADRHGGFFASVDGAPAAGYRSMRVSDETALDRGPGRAITIVTGEYGAHVLAPLLADLSESAGVPVRLLPIANRFFGGNIAVTGLLTGADVARSLAVEPDDQRYLLPDVVLSEGRFLDDRTVGDLPRAVEVVATDGAALVAALRQPVGAFAQPAVAPAR
jgi:putative radical SAM enzyme (TIGR03279 family)